MGKFIATFKEKVSGQYTHTLTNTHMPGCSCCATTPPPTGYHHVKYGDTLKACTKPSLKYASDSHLWLPNQVLPSSECHALVQHIVIDHRINARWLQWWQNQGSSVANREDLHYGNNATKCTLAHVCVCVWHRRNCF